MNAQIAKQQSEINDRVALLNKSATWWTETATTSNWWVGATETK
jgi:hypothetical protein